MKRKTYAEAHAPNTKFGSGDYYGTGFKQPLGKMRDTYMGDKPKMKKSLLKPPKKLA